MGHAGSTLAFAADWTDHPASWNRTNSTLGLSDVSPAFVDGIGKVQRFGVLAGIEQLGK